jgi:hypothetical protein
MMVNRNTRPLSAMLATLLCWLVDADRKLRSSPSSSLNTEADLTKDEVPPSRSRDLWGREYSFGTLLDYELERGSFKEGKYPHDEPSFGLQPSDLGRPHDIMDNSLVGRVVPVGSISDGGNPLEQEKAVQATPRIVGGTGDSNFGPFAMQLRYDDTELVWKFSGCGGTLISNCHILTAAHCVTGVREGSVQGVYVNAWRPFHNNSDGIFVEPYHFSTLLDIVHHPDFDDATNVNDVAIMTMSTCTNDFEIIEIADALFMTGVKTDDFTKVAGFGQVAFDNAAVVETLQSADVLYIEGSDCRLLYYGSQIQEDMVCAGYPEGGRDSCQGDSGVSVLWKGKQLYAINIA